jgi:antirestriction protein ArdC
MRAEVKARDVPVLPEWSQLLVDAVKEHGVISSAYHRFWNYSVGNQILVLFQCMRRNLEPGPINTYLRWKELGRSVIKGEKALTLCMPVTCKTKKEVVEGEDVDAEKDDTYTRFVYRPHWFLLSQTTGEPYRPQELPEWSEGRALRNLAIERVPFDYLNGNAQGFARQRAISVSPIAFAPHRTLFHELAHVVLGHTQDEEMSDEEEITVNLREVEAECVALICCESLRLSGAEFCRGYIQHWLKGEAIPERSAQRIFKAADQVLRGGRIE